MITTRAKKLLKLMNRLMKNQHLFAEEKIDEMNSQIRILKSHISQIEATQYRGFGKK